MRIRITWPNGALEGELNDRPTARALYEALPVQGPANTWGEEVYFSVAVDASLDDDANDVVDPGAICYWVEGSALALPYGPTPASEGDECRLVAPVNTVGKLLGDPQQLSTINPGDTIVVDRA